MAVLGSSVYTVADIVKGYNNQKALDIVEALAQYNQVLEDATMKEGNTTTGELAEIRTSLPTSYWRLHNQGIPESKATSAQIQFNCGMLFNRAQLAKTVADLNGGTKTARLKAANAALQSMAQEVAGTMFYGSAASPEEFVGLANTYSALTGNNSQNVISAGGSGSDNTSVYLLGWSDDTIYTVYPKGTQAGLQSDDLGLIDAFDADNYRYRAYVEEFSWKIGLVVKDWQYGVRIPNIDVSDLASLATTQATTASTFLPKLMSRAIDRIPAQSGVKLAFYGNRSVASLLRIAAMEKSSSAVTIETAVNQFGKSIQELRFYGIPFRICDQLLNTESAVS